jgi:hypothetical protein
MESSFKDAQEKLLEAANFFLSGDPTDQPTEAETLAKARVLALFVREVAYRHFREEWKADMAPVISAIRESERIDHTDLAIHVGGDEQC